MLCVIIKQCNDLQKLISNLKSMSPVSCDQFTTKGQLIKSYLVDRGTLYICLFSYKLTYFTYISTCNLYLPYVVH